MNYVDYRNSVKLRANIYRKKVAFEDFKVNIANVFKCDNFRDADNCKIAGFGNNQIEEII